MGFAGKVIVGFLIVIAVVGLASAIVAAAPAIAVCIVALVLACFFFAGAKKNDLPEE